jgi:hypothetical protein
MQSIVVNTKNLIELCTIYHYVIFGLIGFLFVIIFISSFFIKNGWIAFLSIILSIIFVIISPLVANYYINDIVKNVQFKNLKSKRLVYSDDVVISGLIENRGKLNFKECKVTFTFTKNNPNIYMTYINMLKPLQVEHMSIPLNSKTEEEINVVFPTKLKDFKLFLEAECKQ